MTSFGNALAQGFYFRPAVPFPGSKGESTNRDVPGPTEKIPRGRILDARGGDPIDHVGKTAEPNGRRAANWRLVLVTITSVAPLRGNGPRPAFPTRGPKAEAAEKRPVSVAKLVDPRMLEECECISRAGQKGGRHFFALLKQAVAIASYREAAGAVSNPDGASAVGPDVDHRGAAVDVLVDVLAVDAVLVHLYAAEHHAHRSEQVPKRTHQLFNDHLQGLGALRGNNSPSFARGPEAGAVASATALATKNMGPMLYRPLDTFKHTKQVSRKALAQW